jgi:sporulation protein YabP
MAETRSAASKHAVHMEDRGALTITGVTDVASFDETEITAETTAGSLVVKGRNLRVSKLNLGTGDLGVDGEITGLAYGVGGKAKTPLMSRLFK